MRTSNRNASNIFDLSKVLPTSPSNEVVEKSGSDSQSTIAKAEALSFPPLTTDVIITGSAPVSRSSDVLPEVVFPEGGLRGWLTVFGGFLFQFVCIGYMSSFGVFQDFYLQNFLPTYTPSEIGWIGGMNVMLTFSVGVISGPLFDAGYFYGLMVASLLFHGISGFMLSLAQPNAYYQVFLTNGVGMGLSAGLSFIPTVGIMGHYFSKRRALAGGILSTGAALGAVVHPILLNKLIENPKIGFATALRIGVGMNMVLLILGISVMRTRIAPKPISMKMPVTKWLNPRKDGVYFWFFLAYQFFGFCAFFPVFDIQLYSLLHGVNREFSIYTTSILNAASMVGRIASGFLAVYIGTFNAGVFCFISAAITLFCMVAVSDLPGVVCFSVVYGIFYGACFSLSPILLAQLADDVSEIGARIALCYGLRGLLGLFARPVAGALLTTSYVWIRPVLFCGCCMALAAGFCVMARLLLSRQAGSRKV